MNMALALLQLQGVRILNYLDDWKIVAQSWELVISHRDMVLDHLRSSGLSMSPPWHPCHRIKVTCRGFCTLIPWTRSQFLSRGVQLGGVCRHKTITTYAFLMGWGAVYQGRLAFEVWEGV